VAAPVSAAAAAAAAAAADDDEDENAAAAVTGRVDELCSEWRRPVPSPCAQPITDIAPAVTWRRDVMRCESRLQQYITFTLNVKWH